MKMTDILTKFKSRWMDGTGISAKNERDHVHRITKWWISANDWNHQITTSNSKFKCYWPAISFCVGADSECCLHFPCVRLRHCTLCVSKVIAWPCQFMASIQSVRCYSFVWTDLRLYALPICDYIALYYEWMTPFGTKVCPVKVLLLKYDHIFSFCPLLCFALFYTV